MDNKLEFRVQKMNLRTDGEMMIVEGLVNKTETWSQMLGNVKRFKEKIVKGAFTKAINEAPYIDFLAEHDKSKILATTSNDSLELFEDEEGLKMRARIVPTAYGKDYYTLIKENIINHMSFGFSVLGQEFRRLSDGTYERTVTALKLFEVSAVRQPAYLASNISARGIEIVEDIDIPDEIDVPVEETEEERALNEELLTSILEQLKVNNSLLEGLKITTPQDIVKEEEPKSKDEEVINPVQEEEFKEDVKETSNEEVINDTPKDKTDSEELKEEKPEATPKNDVVLDTPNPPKNDIDNVQPMEEETKEKTIDLSTQKEILEEIMKGEK